MPYKKYLQQILPIDIITFGYMMLTAIYIFFGAGRLDKIFILLGYRLLFLAIIGMLIYFNTNSNNKIIRFWRHFYPLAFLLYFYPETDSINNYLFDDLDSLVANLEATIFGGQPSIWFSHFMPWKWFAEIMSFGYFSYFPMIFIFCIIIYKKSFENFSFVIFVICMTFFMYYSLFILFPVAGPQFYLTPPDNQLPDGYVFSSIMKFIQGVGERPTAAFPSSHVGVMTILLILTFKFRPKLLRWYLPLAMLLYFSTVYLKAHYVIDVIAGLLTVPTMYWISSNTYLLLTHGLSQEHKILTVFNRMRTSVLFLLQKSKRK